MRYIKLDDNGKVLYTRSGKTIVEGEIQSDIGNPNQLIQSDGTFIDDPYIINETIKFSRISELRQLISDKKLIDEQCEDEQLELKTLLGI